MVSGHTAKHADAGELIGEQLSVVILQLVDLFLLVRRYAVHRLKRLEQEKVLKAWKVNKKEEEERGIIKTHFKHFS